MVSLSLSLSLFTLLLNIGFSSDFNFHFNVFIFVLSLLIFLLFLSVLRSVCLVQIKVCLSVFLLSCLQKQGPKGVNKIQWLSLKDMEKDRCTLSLTEKNEMDFFSKDQLLENEQNRNLLINKILMGKMDLVLISFIRKWKLRKKQFISGWS